MSIATKLARRAYQNWDKAVYRRLYGGRKSRMTDAGPGRNLGDLPTQPVLVVVAHPDDEALGAGNLLTRLADAGRTVLLETSGALDIAPVDRRVRVILDLKTPGSGEESANLRTNLAVLKPTDEIKFVLCDRSDFEWAVEQTLTHKLLGRCPVLFSAVFGRVNSTELAAWILETGLPIRLQLQQHKILWDPAARGV